MIWLLCAERSRHCQRRRLCLADPYREEEKLPSRPIFLGDCVSSRVLSKILRYRRLRRCIVNFYFAISCESDIPDSMSPCQHSQDLPTYLQPTPHSSITCIDIVFVYRTAHVTRHRHLTHCLCQLWRRLQAQYVRLNAPLIVSGFHVSWT